MTDVSGRKVLLDTNLLLLLLLGSIDLRQIETNKRVSKYSAHEFWLLQEFIRDAHSLVTTEHINSQTSDLGAGSLDRRYRSDFLNLLQAMHDAGADNPMKTSETIQPIVSLESDIVRKLGVADAGIINTAREKSCVILTDDLQLYLMAQRRGVEAVNFSHLLE
jgi:rRNA-processing protein FCF1